MHRGPHPSRSIDGKFNTMPVLLGANILSFERSCLVCPARLGVDAQCTRYHGNHLELFDYIFPEHMIWVMLHLNVPAKGDTFWTKVWRKTRWFMMSLLAPEFMVLMAYDQLISARQSVVDMKKSGYKPPQWTLTHAYFVDIVEKGYPDGMMYCIA